jgi:hypothetical protein
MVPPEEMVGCDGSDNSLSTRYRGVDVMLPPFNGPHQATLRWGSTSGFACCINEWCDVT